MDIYGDVIGTDGHNLVMFEPDGKIVKPQINLQDKLYPTFRYKKNITIFLFHYIHELYLYIIMNDLYFIFLVWRCQRKPVSLPLFHDKDFWLPMNQVTKITFLFYIFFAKFSLQHNFSRLVFTDNDTMT